MGQTVHPQAASLSEAECLAEVLRLRDGDRPCPACDSTHGFVDAGKHGAFACRACGHAVFPVHGTPLAKLRSPLAALAQAAQLASGGRRPSARALARRLGLAPAAAKQALADIETLRKAPVASGSPTTWFEALAAFAAARLPEAAGPRPAEERETVWQSVLAALPIPDVIRHPAAAGVAILALAAAGAGIGWLAVPAPPEQDTEAEQATAILSLANDKPVILVSKEVAEQLYDVQDVDADAAAPTPTIRIVDASDKGKSPEELAKGAALAPPAIKLSSNVGQSLIAGDVSGAKARASARPELAVYNALASELEGGGNRNPDELLSFGPMRIRRHLVEKIVRAGRATQTDPVLLMAIADKESAFQTEVQAQTSSATGLYQFIASTWLGVLREFGTRYGFAKEAQTIAAGDMPAAERQRILDLRRDAYLSAVLAAEMLKRDALRIQTKIGRPLTGGEVYLIHFLGPDGAERMIATIAAKPDTVAADLLPKPAAANRPIFYASGTDGGTKSLSVAEVHSKFETMMSVRLDRYKTVKAPAPAAPVGKAGAAGKDPPPRPPSR